MSTLYFTVLVNLAGLGVSCFVQKILIVRTVVFKQSGNISVDQEWWSFTMFDNYEKCQVAIVAPVLRGRFKDFGLFCHCITITTVSIFSESKSSCHLFSMTNLWVHNSFTFNFHFLMQQSPAENWLCPSLLLTLLVQTFKRAPFFAGEA